MSYLSDINDIFKSIHPDGTFLFSSEVRADDALRNILPENFPIFVIDNEPLTGQTLINQDAGVTDSPRLKIYALTKYDINGDQVNENNSTQFYQHEQCVEIMKALAVRVLGIYFRTGDNVLRVLGQKPTFNTTDKYNIWSKMLYGVEIDVSNLLLRRDINYCIPSTTWTADSDTVTADSIEATADGSTGV